MTLFSCQAKQVGIGKACEQFGERITNCGARRLGVLRSVDRTQGFDYGVHDIVCRPAGEQSGIEGTRSEEHTSELQSLMRISYAVFCLKKKKKNRDRNSKKVHRKKQTEKQQKQTRMTGKLPNNKITI